MNGNSNNKPYIGCADSVSGISDNASTMNFAHWWMRQKDALSTLRFYTLLLVIVTLPAMIWYQQTGSLSLYFSQSAPPGQLIYVLSKLAGMYALLCIALQIILGLAVRLNSVPMHRMRRLHPLLGTFVVLLALVHALLFFTAVSVRQGDPAWGLLLPGFRDFYHTHLSLGLFGLWILIAVVISGVVRSINRSSAARMLHRGYWASITLVYIHALAVGTESQSRAGLAFYSTLGGVVLIMLVMWLIRHNRHSAVTSNISG